MITNDKLLNRDHPRANTPVEGQSEFANEVCATSRTFHEALTLVRRRFPTATHEWLTAIWNNKHKRNPL